MAVIADDPVLVDDWHPVAASSSVAGNALLATQLLGRELALWRDATGVLHAWEDRCPHRGTRFSIGTVEEGQVVCRYHGWRFATADEVYIRIGGRTHVIGLPQFGTGAGAAGHAEDEVRADMPGTVVSVHCAAGDQVTSGQKLVTIESMKLQISMVAPRDGKIAAVNALPNTTFERGVVLVALEPNKE